MSEIEKPRNLPFIGREYPELKKANKRPEEETKKMLKEINETAKQDVENGKKAIEEMRNEVKEKE